jgi:hypothetical protein
MHNVGVATNYRLVAWGSSGDGSFSHPDSVVTDYTFGTHDKSTGTVTLMMEALPISPCGGNGAQSSKHVILSWCTGISENQNDPFRVSVFPNPTDGNFLLTITGLQSQPATITLSNSQGQNVSAEKTNGENDLTRKMDLTGYAKGIYFLKVQTNDHVSTQKVVVQ